MNSIFTKVFADIDLAIMQSMDEVERAQFIFDQEEEKRKAEDRKKYGWVIESYMKQRREIESTFRMLRKKCPVFKAIKRHEKLDDFRRHHGCAAERKEQRRAAYKESLKRNAFDRLMHLWNHPGKEKTNGYYVIYRHMNYWYNDPYDPYHVDSLNRDEDRWDIVGVFKTETEANAFKSRFRDKEGGDDQEGVSVEYVIIHN